MPSDNSINRAGYLRESFHYFHLRDSAGQELDFHFHEFDKLVILLSGSVDYLVEEQRYTLAPWSVLLVRHHTIHKAVIDRTVPYERIILYLDRHYFERAFPGAGLMDCFDQADRRRRHMLTAAEDQLGELRAAVEALPIPLPNGEKLSVTVSVGFTERKNEDTVEAIIKRADDALYFAKESGRNRVCLNLGDDTMFLF